MWDITGKRQETETVKCYFSYRKRWEGIRYKGVVRGLEGRKIEVVLRSVGYELKRMGMIFVPHYSGRLSYKTCLPVLISRTSREFSL